MKEEKQTRIVSGNPYREAGIVSAGRKLSKEEAKTLIEIVRDESYKIVPDGALEQLSKLGYTDQGMEIYVKGATFYRIGEEDINNSPYPCNRRAIVSGSFYGNLAELIENFKRFDGFCDYVHEKLGVLEIMSIFPLFGLPIFVRTKLLHELAMDLPKDFASYKYGRDAIEQLRQEYLKIQQELPVIDLPQLGPLKISEPLSEEEERRMNIEGAAAFYKTVPRLTKMARIHDEMARKLYETVPGTADKKAAALADFYWPERIIGDRGAGIFNSSMPRIKIGIENDYNIIKDKFEDQYLNKNLKKNLYILPKLEKQ